MGNTTTAKYTVLAMQHNTWDDDAKGPGEPLKRGATLELTESDAKRYGTGVAPYDAAISQRARDLAERDAAHSAVVVRVDDDGKTTEHEIDGLPQLTTELPDGGGTPAPAGNPDAPAGGDAGKKGTLTKPAANGSKKDWKAYAIAQGMDEAAAEATSRDDLAEHYKES